MALQSPLLNGSPRLVQASNGAPSVKMGPPHDDPDAVRRIQKALKQLTGSPMPRSFKNGPAGEPDGIFGQETASTTIAFQKKVFPNSPVEWDGRVGKKTLAQMDARLGSGPLPPSPPPGPLPPVPPPRPGPNPGPTPGGLEIINQPFGNELLLAEIEHNLAKSDLNSAQRKLNSGSRLAKARVWLAKLGVGIVVLDQLEKLALKAGGFSDDFDIRDFVVKMIMSGNLEAAALTEITVAMLKAFPDVDTALLTPRSVKANEQLLLNEMSVGGNVAREMFTFWTGFSSATPLPKQFASLDQTMSGTPGFVAGAKRFESRLDENVKAQAKAGLIDFRDLVTGTGPTRKTDDVPPTEPGAQTKRTLPAIEPVIPQLSLVNDKVAKICIGSFQGCKIFMKSFTADAKTRSYNVQIRYQLFDHFGVDDDDCEISRAGIHGTPGQVAMWVLQHFAGSGHRPFIDDVTVTRQVIGKF